jgi:hypothetical protein
MNLVASGNYPFVQFQPGETSGVQHTDQEFTDSNGNSYLFRMYNAEFDPNGPNWKTLTAGDSNAYATVQNPDGSIHYYTNPPGETTWSTWVGSDNNTIYNAVDFGVAGSGSPTSNSAALTSLFTAMVTAAGLGGGMARIPQFNFPVLASTGGIIVPSEDGIGGYIIQGLGTGGNGNPGAFHFSITDPVTTGPSIFLNSTGNHTSGGTFFKNLAFRWITPEYPADTCLNLDVWNNGVDSCTFTDCPTAMNFQGLAGSARRCTIHYTYSTQPNVTAIIVQGEQTEISGPSEMDGHSVGGTSTCILIGGGPTNCEHITIRGLHIYGWSYGIDYSDINHTGTGSGTQDNVIDGNKIDCLVTCINLVPQGGKQIFNQIFSNNEITKNHDSTGADPIVYIDCNTAGGGSAANIGPILLINNVIYSDVTAAKGTAMPNQYGVQIGTCEAVSIIGGQISNVGTKTSAGSDGTANICISGSPVSVIISDVNLAASYAGANSGQDTGDSGSAASEFALLITGDPSYVQVDNCYMGGPWAGSPVSVTGTPGRLIITNCAGYNDQNTPINTLPNISIGTAYSAAAAGAHAGTSYYGPSFVIFKAANASNGTFQYNGGAQQTLLANQVVCLTLASPYDTIQFNAHAPAAFTWIGK